MTAHDRGLHAVARVRGVRERDSRIGLGEALDEERQARTRAEALERRLASLPPHTVGDLTAFTTHQHTARAIGDAAGAARESSRSASVIAQAARDAWAADRSRLAAAESLLERRAEERRAEEQRLEDRRLDAVAEELWLRARANGGRP